MENTGLQNEGLISELLLSGSHAIHSKNNYGVYVFEDGINNDGVISGKLSKPKYDESELIKSIDTNIIELIPVKAPELPDMVLRVIYNEVTQSVVDLTAQVSTLNRTVLDLSAKVQEVEIVSESLRVEIDLKSLNVASSQNQTAQISTKIVSTIGELQNAIQKGTSEAIQRVSLYARNQSLQQEIDALRLAASAKEQALAAGAVSTGQLASILWEKGDPLKGEGKGYAYDMDLNGGGGNVQGPAGYAKGWSSSWVEVIASTLEDITVNIKQTFFQIESTFDLKAGDTKRITFNKPNQTKVPSGGNGFLGLGSSRKDYEEDIIISVTGKKGNKTEDKSFKGKVHSYK